MEAKCSQCHRFICHFLLKKTKKTKNIPETPLYCSTCASLLNEGIMCTGVHAKFAVEIMDEPQSCGAQGYKLIPQQQPR